MAPVPGAGLAYRDFIAAHVETEDKPHEAGAWLFNPGMRELPREESDRRAAAGELSARSFVSRFLAMRAETWLWADMVYGNVSKAADDMEDFALLRSSGVPANTWPLVPDDADLRITHILRGQATLPIRSTLS